MPVLRYLLLAAMTMVCVGLAPTSPVRAETTMYGSTGVVTAAILKRSYIDMTSSVAPSFRGRGASDVDRSSLGVANPAPLPGLLLFAATGLAYLWHWRSKRREKLPRILT